MIFVRTLCWYELIRDITFTKSIIFKLWYLLMWHKQLDHTDGRSVLLWCRMISDCNIRARLLCATERSLQRIAHDYSARNHTCLLAFSWRQLSNPYFIKYCSVAMLIEQRTVFEKNPIRNILSDVVVSVKILRCHFYQEEVYQTSCCLSSQYWNESAKNVKMNRKRCLRKTYLIKIIVLVIIILFNRSGIFTNCH